MASSTNSSFWRKRWPLIAGLLAAAILIFDFFSKGVGVVDRISEWITPQPTPTVLVSPVEVAGGGTCVEFAFGHLPDDFVLGEIRLDIVSAFGPTPIAGDMAAEVIARTVNMEVSPAVLSGQTEEISFRAAIQSEREEDVAYVDFCPVLSMPGMSGELLVVPTFYSPSGTLIEAIEISTHDGSPIQDGVAVNLSRPRNTAVSLEEARFRLVTR